MAITLVLAPRNSAGLAALASHRHTALSPAAFRSRFAPSTGTVASPCYGDNIINTDSHAILVNAARGSVTDTGALLAEVSKGRLRAALDVTSPEPLPPGHPLWTAPGVLITPHVAASTPLSLKRVARLVREQAESYLRGDALRNVITDAY